MLHSHLLKHFLLAFDPPTAVQIALLDRLEGGSMLTIDTGIATFDLAAFLTHTGLGRRIVEVMERENFFSQGDPADSVFYLQHGRAKLPNWECKRSSVIVTYGSANIMRS